MSRIQYLLEQLRVLANTPGLSYTYHGEILIQEFLAVERKEYESNLTSILKQAEEWMDKAGFPKTDSLIDGSGNVVAENEPIPFDDRVYYLCEEWKDLSRECNV